MLGLTRESRCIDYCVTPNSKSSPVRAERPGEARVRCAQECVSMDGGGPPTFRRAADAPGRLLVES